MSAMTQERQDPFKPNASDEPKAEAGFSPSRASVVPTTAAMTRLANRVIEEFRKNAEHRRLSNVDAMLEYAATASKMMYSQGQIDILRQCGIDPRNYRPLTPMKIRAARAMLNDIIKQSGDKFYVLSPTPDPEVPKSVQRKILADIAQEIVRFYAKVGGALEDERQVAAFQIAIIRRVNEMFDEQKRRQVEWAKVRCERMDRKIHDQMVEGNFVSEFAKLVNYICTYGTALMVGPCPRVVPVCACRERETGAGPVVKYVREYAVKPVYEAVSPWDCYPSPNAKDVADGTLCIKVRFTPNVLWQYAEAMRDEKNGPDGWQPETVRAFLSQHPNGGVRLDADAYDLVRRGVERDSVASDRDCTIEGIRCFGSFRGSDLIPFGLSRTPDGERIVYHRFYKVEAIVIAGYVVYCRIIDDRMPLPVAKATLYESPGSWWGDTIADLLYSAQSMQNNALKNLTLNGAISSNGMFYCTDVNRAVSLDGTPALALRAGKMLGFKQSPLGNAGAPVGVLSVPDVTQSQIRIMEFAAKCADDDCGIPQYSIGSSQNISGAGRTASGLAMMSEAACRVINMCICDLGRNLIVNVVRNTHIYNLLNDDDMSIKGDVEINPSGLMGKILREAESQRRQQVTAMLGQHPVLSKAITVEGFFELIRPELENIGVNVDKIIPSRERMEMYQLILDTAQAQQAAQGAPEQGEPTPEQENVARVEGQPEQVALSQGSPAPGSVAERRNVG